MPLLQDHKKAKEKKVNGWDIISTGLGIGASLLVGTCFMQSKNPVNAARLPVAFLMFGASVAAERLRESELLSLDKAIEYEANFKSEQIKLDQVLTHKLDTIAIAEDYYARLPQDRWGEIQELTGINPPNLEARKPDTLIETLEKPKDEPLPDPAVGYDPEEQPEGDPWEQPEENQEDRSFFIPKKRVEEWFKTLGDNLPQSLKDEWEGSEGAIGIEVNNNEAKVIKNGG